MLRTSRLLRWWVVACFVASLGAALVSSLAQPRSMELVCSGVHGTTVVVHAGTGNPVLDQLGADCALCLLGSAPPPRPALARAGLPAPHLLPAPPSLALAPSPTAAPPPARGPPSISV